MTIICRSLDYVAIQHRGVRAVTFPDFADKEGGTLTVKAWYTLCDLMTRTLQGLHDAGIVHGDVKLANFCVTLDDEENIEGVRIIDFGALDWWKDQAYLYVLALAVMPSTKPCQLQGYALGDA
jgi:serine/threonine protein kinase